LNTEAEFREFLRKKREQGDCTLDNSNETLALVEKESFESTKHEKIFNVQDTGEMTDVKFCDEIGITMDEFSQIKESIVE
jgi:hypothetical protein